MSAENKNKEGPSGTFGCICTHDDEKICAIIRNKNISICTCLCHKWRKQVLSKGH